MIWFAITLTLSVILKLAYPLILKGTYKSFTKEWDQGEFWLRMRCKALWPTIADVALSFLIMLSYYKATNDWLPWIFFVSLGVHVVVFYITCLWYYNETKKA